MPAFAGEILTLDVVAVLRQFAEGLITVGYKGESFARFCRRKFPREQWVLCLSDVCRSNLGDTWFLGDGIPQFSPGVEEVGYLCCSNRSQIPFRFSSMKPNPGP